MDSNDEATKEEIAFLESLLESKHKYRKIIQAAIAQWVKDFQNGSIMIRSVDDLKTLMQIDLELQKSMRYEKKLQSRSRDVE